MSSITMHKSVWNIKSYVCIMLKLQLLHTKYNSACLLLWCCAAEVKCSLEFLQGIRLVTWPILFLHELAISCLICLTWLNHTSFLPSNWTLSEIPIFGLKMMVKSGLEKIFFEIPSCRRLIFLTSRPLFTIIFRPKMVIWDTDSILRVKPMYESVK